MAPCEDRAKGQPTQMSVGSDERNLQLATPTIQSERRDIVVNARCAALRRFVFGGHPARGKGKAAAHSCRAPGGTAASPVRNRTQPRGAITGLVPSATASAERAHQSRPLRTPRAAAGECCSVRGGELGGVGVIERSSRLSASRLLPCVRDVLAEVHWTDPVSGPPGSRQPRTSSVLAIGRI